MVAFYTGAATPVYMVALVGVQESLSERLQRKAAMSVSAVLQQLCLQLLAWLLSVGLALGSCAGIYFLSYLVSFPPIRTQNHVTIARIFLFVVEKKHEL